MPRAGQHAPGRSAAVIAALFAFLVWAAGCGRAAVDGPGEDSPGGSPTGAASGPPSVPVSASPGSTRGDGCLTGTVEITVRSRQAPAQLCLAAGAVLTVTSEPSPLQPWQPLSTSDDSVLACTSHQGADGTVAGTCRALRPGTATLSTSTGPFAGDPHGPPQYAWRLTVTVRN